MSGRHIRPGRPHSAETRAKMAQRRREAWERGVYASVPMGKTTAAMMRVTFTPDMDATFLRLFWRGRDMEYIKEVIGVGLRTLEKRRKELRLPNRRHTKGFYRWSIDRYAAIGIVK